MRSFGKPVFDKHSMVKEADALPGRAARLPLANRHLVLDAPLTGDFTGLEDARFGMGCFWGAERLFWQMPGVASTAVGYAGGFTPNATYEEVCSGGTGHAEVVRVLFDPHKVSYETLLNAFWEQHDPTQGMRQGADHGTQYRSVIHCTTPDQQRAALASRDAYQARLSAAGLGAITTEIVFPAPQFNYAEEFHQQYLARNPHGYCGLGGTGVRCAAGTGA